ncbi:MAG: site-2 protease family protein [Candidatus Woesearchaeota archaeon]
MNLIIYVFIIFVLLISLIFLLNSHGNYSVHLTKIPFIFTIYYKFKNKSVVPCSVIKLLKKLNPYISFFGFFGLFISSFLVLMLFISILLGLKIPNYFVPIMPFVLKGTIYSPYPFWIFGFFIAVIIHEFVHYMMFRVYDVKVYDMCFGINCLLLPFFPFGFVDADLDNFGKLSNSKKISIFASGALSNIMSALILILISIFVFDLNFVVETQQKVTFLHLSQAGLISKNYAGFSFFQKLVGFSYNSGLQILLDILLWTILFNFLVGLLNFLPIKKTDGRKIFRIFLFAIFQNNKQLAEKIYIFADYMFQAIILFLIIIFPLSIII